jgi:hypothetical protein
VKEKSKVKNDRYYRSQGINKRVILITTKKSEKEIKKMKEKNNEGRTIGLGAEVVREGYEASVANRMTGRAGAYTPKGAPGNALEIMANDRSNLNNIFKPDTVTKLTKSSTATQVDAVTTQAGKVVERIQYKDTVSPSGVQKTLNQVKAGKYQQAQLKGTIEATERYNAKAAKAGISKSMQSTGISHNATQRVGDKFTKQPVRATSIGDAVKGSTAASVGITAAIETGKSIVNGDSLGECTSHIVSKGAESAISTATATAAAEVTMSAASGLLATSAIPILGPTVVGIGTAVLVGSAMGEITDGVFDDVASDIGDAVEDVVSGVGDVVDDVVSGVGDVVDDIASGIGDVVSDIGGGIFDFVGGLFW